MRLNPFSTGWGKGRVGIVLGILLAGGGVAVGGWLNGPPSGATGGYIEVPPGVSARSIARQLYANGHVRSAVWLEVMARILRADQKLKAGAYRIPPHQRADKILRALLLGRGAAERVTLPEGFAVWQIADRLEASKVCSAAEFRAVATAWEGFLFPDTYFFERNSPPLEVLGILRGRFDTVWGEVFQSAVEAGNVKKPRPAGPREPDDLFEWADGQRWSLRQAVTLASLIERETARDKERPRVSAVYHNRLKKKMRLECDPTVQYALGEWKTPLYKKDLRTDSPYNTYRRYGLPPSPIASPGRGSLAAALAPAVEKSLYFVSDGEGGHWFNTTYEAHRQAVREFRRGKRGAVSPATAR